MKHTESYTNETNLTQVMGIDYTSMCNPRNGNCFTLVQYKVVDTVVKFTHNMHTTELVSNGLGEHLKIVFGDRCDAFTVIIMILTSTVQTSTNTHTHSMHQHTLFPYAPEATLC